MASFTTDPQAAIRNIPDSISGIDASAMLHDYASQVRVVAVKAPDNILQRTYGLSQAYQTADDLDNAATRYAVFSKIVRPSKDYSDLQVSVGSAVIAIAGLQGQIQVFDAADAGFIQDLKDNAKGLANGIGFAGLGVLGVVVVGGLAYLVLRARRA